MFFLEKRTTKSLEKRTTKSLEKRTTKSLEKRTTKPQKIKEDGVVGETLGFPTGCYKFRHNKHRYFYHIFYP